MNRKIEKKMERILKACDAYDKNYLISAFNKAALQHGLEPIEAIATLALSHAAIALLVTRMVLMTNKRKGCSNEYFIDPKGLYTLKID